MVPANSDRISRVPPYSGYCLSISGYVYEAFTLFRLAFQANSTYYKYQLWQSYNPNNAITLLVWAISISIATTLEITIVFSSSGYLDVSVLRVSLPCGMFRLHRNGLPHWEILGLTVICTYPKLIAAYHVLLRLWEPRHSPYALNDFLPPCLLLGFISFNYFALLYYSVCQRP